MVLKFALLTLEPLLLTIRPCGMLTLRSWASLTRVLRINIVGQNPFPRSLIRNTGENPRLEPWDESVTAEPNHAIVAG